ncbi:MAG: hypothetical protein WCJ02_17255 [bacterium]
MKLASAQSNQIETGAHGQTIDAQPCQTDTPPVSSGVDSLPSERQGTDGKPRSLPPPRKPSIQHEKDKLGNIIPPNLLEIWGGRDSVKEASSAVRGVRLAIKKAQDKHDQTWAGLNFSNALMHLDNVIAQVRGAIPHCVCLYCQGIGCRACRGVGIMTEFQYSNLPREMKESTERQGSDGKTRSLPPPRPLRK